MSRQAVGTRVAEDGDAPADTTNKALDDMLAEFMADPDAKEISHDSWTYATHRFLGYAVLIGAVTQAALGIYTYNQRKEDPGTVPGTVDAHRYLGYTIVGLSVVQTGIGFYNFWKIRDRDTGRKKRWVHLGLSTLATAGFIAATSPRRRSPTTSSAVIRLPRAAAAGLGARVARP